MQALRALIFDFDGLIIDTESAHLESYEEIHRAHGLSFNRDLFRKHTGQAVFSFDPWHAFGQQADRPALDSARRKRNRELDLTKPILPGVLSLLDEALTAGLLLGVASNSTHPHVDGNLTRLGLRERFSFVACREDVPSPKPEPDIYRLVLNRLGLKPSQAIAIEDSQIGVTAAVRAGIKTVAVPGPTTDHQDFAEASLEVRSLASVTLDKLRSL